jgi:hypothetical protein
MFFRKKKKILKVTKVNYATAFIINFWKYLGDEIDNINQILYKYECGMVPDYSFVVFKFVQVGITHLRQYPQSQEFQNEIDDAMDGFYNRTPHLFEDDLMASSIFYDVKWKKLEESGQPPTITIILELLKELNIFNEDLDAIAQYQLANEIKSKFEVNVWKTMSNYEIID